MSFCEVGVVVSYALLWQDVREYKLEKRKDLFGLKVSDLPVCLLLLLDEVEHHDRQCLV